MAIQTRTIKGQPSILGKSLVQDQILLVTTDGKTVRDAMGQEVLIPDIWEDLMDPAGTWKKKKNYFYWEVDVSDTSEDGTSDAVVKQMVTCPKPEPELFNYNYEASGSDSDWTAYWKLKFKTTEETKYNNTNAVYRKEVILPGTKYVKFGNVLTQGQDDAVQDPETGAWTAEEVVVDQVTVDMDDTMNLLAQQESSTGTDLSDINGLLGSLF